MLHKMLQWYTVHKPDHRRIDAGLAEPLLNNLSSNEMGEYDGRKCNMVCMLRSSGLNSPWLLPWFFVWGFNLWGMDVVECSEIVPK